MLCERMVNSLFDDCELNGGGKGGIYNKKGGGRDIVIFEEIVVAVLDHAS